MTGGDRGLGELGRVHHRDDYAVGRKVEVGLYEHRLVGADAHKAGAARAAKRNQVALDVLYRVRCMLRVDPHEVHPAVARELAHDEVAHGYDRADGRAAAFEVPEKPVLFIALHRLQLVLTYNSPIRQHYGISPNMGQHVNYKKQ